MKFQLKIVRNKFEIIKFYQSNTQKREASFFINTYNFTIKNCCKNSFLFIKSYICQN